LCGKIWAWALVLNYPLFFVPGSARCNSALCLLETAFFNIQTIREIKIENNKLGGKKMFPQFLLSMYVFCVFVCLFVCLSVIALQTSSFDIGVWNFNIDTYIKISQNGIFYFFEFLLFFGVIPLFHFSLFSLFRDYESTYHGNQYTKLKFRTSRIYQV